MDADAAAAVNQAIALFDQQKYQEAFEMFAEVYQRCQDLTERQKIFQMLEEVYYLPNVDELRQTYESNAALLKKYRYFWNKSFHAFGELSFQLFPITDELYYCYNRENRRFCGLYDAKTRNQMRYFFENLDKPLRIEDEDNFYNLSFLCDNVRRSEDFAGDNHIYLLYTSLEPLERLMLTCDLEPILQQEKFVFLIGQNNWKKYPINFKKRFGVDYRKSPPAPLKIEEINRICLNQYYPYSGTDFFQGVLNGSDHVLVLNGWFFYESSKEIVNTFLNYVRHPDETVDVNAFFSAAKKRIADVKFSGWPYMVSVLPGILKGRETVRIHELWKAVMIAAMMVSEKEEGKNYHSRISPVIFFDPHGGPNEDYYELLKYFKYPFVEAVVREPVTRLLRYVSALGYGDAITAVVGSTYTHSKNIPKWLTDSGFYVARLEDIKLKPEQTLRGICRAMNIPYTEKLLIGKVGMWGVLFTNEKGEQLIGFDQRSVKRDISDMVAGDDMDRLNKYYRPIIQYFRYPCSEEDHPLSADEAKVLFSRPFHFEKIYAERREALKESLASASLEKRNYWQNYFNAHYRTTPEDGRTKIWVTMTETYTKGLYEGLALPEVIFPEEDGAARPLSQSQRLQGGVYE